MLQLFFAQAPAPVIPAIDHSTLYAAIATLIGVVITVDRALTQVRAYRQGAELRGTPSPCPWGASPETVRDHEEKLSTQAAELADLRISVDQRFQAMNEWLRDLKQSQDSNFKELRGLCIEAIKSGAISRTSP